MFHLVAHKEGRRRGGGGESEEEGRVKSEEEGTGCDVCVKWEVGRSWRQN